MFFPSCYNEHMNSAMESKMSMSYAAVIYGLRVEEQFDITHTRERGCMHAVAEDASFCSKCGAPVWKTKTGYKPTHNLLELFRERLPRKLMCICREYISGDGAVFYVGLGRVVDGYRHTTLPLLTPELKEEILQGLRPILEPIGLYSEKNFQLHIMTDM
jgi:hypothetical protein